MTCYADIEPLETAWLWEGRILAGDVTLMPGASGIGKSFLMCDLASRVTRGAAMPDGSYGGPAGSVILASAEDDAHAMAWRLRASGADLSKVHDAGQDLELPGSIPALRQMIAMIGDVRLVVIDPLSAVTSVALGANVTVRRNILRPLQALARDTGVAIVLVHHLTKAGVIGGSQGLVDGVRSVLLVERDQDNNAVRWLRVVKSNAAGDVQPMRYTLAGQDTSTAVSWLWSDSEAAGPAQSRILLAVHSSHRPLTGPELAALTGINHGTVRVLLHKLTRRGLLAQPARGLYSAPITERAS